MALAWLMHWRHPTSCTLPRVHRWGSCQASLLLSTVPQTLNSGLLVATAEADLAALRAAKAADPSTFKDARERCA